MKINIKTALLGALICATVMQPMQAMNRDWKDTVAEITGTALGVAVGISTLAGSMYGQYYGMSYCRWILEGSRSSMQPMQVLSFREYWSEAWKACEVVGWKKVACATAAWTFFCFWLNKKYEQQIDMRFGLLLGFSRDRQLYNAIQKNDRERAKYLLGNGANIHATDSGRGTPLHWAVFNNHPEMVKFLVENGANMHADDSNRGTPLHYAAMQNRPEMVKCLVESGAHVNILCGEGFWVPLHYAAYYHDNLETVKLMLEHGAHIDSASKCSRTAYRWAVERGNVNVASLLQNCENYRKFQVRMKVTEQNKNVIPSYLALDVFAQDIEGIRKSFDYLFSGIDQGSDEFGQNIKLVNHLLRKTEQMKLTSANKELAFLKMKLGNQKPTIHSEFDAHNKLRLVVIKNRTNINDVNFKFV